MARSLLDESLSGKFVELAGQIRISGAISQLFVKGSAGEPPSATAVGHDVRDRLAMDGQRHSFSRLHGVDHLTGPVTQIADANLHVRQCSTNPILTSPAGRCARPLGLL